MARETKIGLMMVALLVGVFGFLAYKHYNHPPEATADAGSVDANTSDSANSITSESAQRDGFANDGVLDPLDPPAEPKKKRKKPKLQPVVAQDDSDFDQPRSSKTSWESNQADQSVESATNKFDDFSTPKKTSRSIQPVAATTEADPFTSDSNSTELQSDTQADNSSFETPKKPLRVPVDLDVPNADTESQPDSDPFSSEDTPKLPSPPSRNDTFGGRDDFAPRKSPRQPATVNDDFQATDPDAPVEPAPRRSRQAKPAPVIVLDDDSSQDAPALIPGSPSEETYVVQPSDSYWSISRKRYGTGRYFNALFKHNEQTIPDPQKMKPGTTIATPPASVLDRLYGDLSSKGTSLDSNLPSSSAQSRTSADLPQPGLFVGDDGSPMYRIGEGDTLTQIAKAQLGRTARWVQILEMNRNVLRDGNELKVGTVLRLPNDTNRVQVGGTSRQTR